MSGPSECARRKYKAMRYARYRKQCRRASRGISRSMLTATSTWISSRYRRREPYCNLTLFPRFRLIDQKLRQPRAHRVRFARTPFAQALAALHAELTGLELLAQEGRRVRGPVKMLVKHLGDIEREVEADEVRLLHRSEHRSARAKALLNDGIDRLGIADASRDQRESLTLHGMLQTIADKARNVAADVNRHFA